MVSPQSSKTRSSGVSWTHGSSSSTTFRSRSRSLSAQQRSTHQVGEDIEREREIGVENVRLERGGIAGGVAHRGNRPRSSDESNLARGAALGALEDHMFEQVRYTHHGAASCPLAVRTQIPAAADRTPGGVRSRPRVRSGRRCETARRRAESCAPTAPHSFGRSAFRDRRIRPRSSTSSSFTVTISPS